jgi:hypothetical protein
VSRLTELQARVDSLGPWYSSIEIDGRRFGGEHSFKDDPRVSLFFSWFGRPRSILELGSFEGAHSVMLAAPDHVERVLGVEGRPENIRRAELCADLFGRGKIEYRHANLESDSLSEYGRFDAVFCAGVLYHLSEPWRLLGEIAAITDRLFLDTHYAAVEEREWRGHAGADFTEGGYDDPLSGLGPVSFWLTLPDLIRSLNSCGFAVRQLQDHSDWAGAGRRLHLCAVKADALWRRRRFAGLFAMPEEGLEPPTRGL